MKHTNICSVEKQDHLKLIKIWEESVRATQDFLPENEIHELKPLILNHYFDAVVLKCWKNTHSEIIGFIGVAEKKIEMLFISPNAQLAPHCVNMLFNNSASTKSMVKESLIRCYIWKFSSK